MNERDELAKVIESGYGLDESDCPYNHAPFIADAILAAGYRKPRTITTAEELDALPTSSLIREADGFTAIREHGGWLLCIPDASYHRGADDIEFPATVLWEPK